MEWLPLPEELATKINPEECTIEEGKDRVVIVDHSIQSAIYQCSSICEAQAMLRVMKLEFTCYSFPGSEIERQAYNKGYKAGLKGG